MMNAAVIGGLGMVGKATRHSFGIEDYFDLNGSTISLKEIGESKKYVFICLPTPTINGECYVKDIEMIIKAIEEHGGRHLYIIRSTVTPGTTRGMSERLGIRNIIHNPEFLTESTWQQDSEAPDIVVIGSDYPAYGEELEAIYKSRFKGTNIFKTDTITSEMVKYAINTFYATKVTFANEMYDIARKLNANYEMIKNIMYSRKWIGHNHLDVWHGEQRGFGGKCLPKDTESFQRFTGSRLLKLILEMNEDNTAKHE